MFEFKQEISEQIYTTKYKGKDADVDKTFQRVAKDIAAAEKITKRKHWEEKFYKILSSGKFIPGGRIMANAGTSLRYYNNCYAIGVEDNMSSIYDSLKEDAIISQVGGGVGFDISTLRPKNAPLSKGGVSSGPVSFLEIFDKSAMVIQTAGLRRSAHIALMDISHPDIEEFITCKQGDENKKLTQFNISVKITDKFMQAVQEDKDWDLVFKGKVYKTVKARDLFEMWRKNAFTHNEPGAFHTDVVNRYNNGYYAFNIDQVNPCGEITLAKYELCCLGAINLTQFVLNPFTGDAVFKFKEFADTIKIAVRFLDNVLDRTDYPLEKVKKNSLTFRRIGLGFTGLGDMFAMLCQSYGDKQSKVTAKYIAKTLRDISYNTSIDLAKEKGKFPGYKKAILESLFIMKLPREIKTKIRKYGLRNVALNTCAPTGTISLSFGNNCSSGIEPIFELEYDRRIRTGKEDEEKTVKIQNYAWMLYKGKYGERERPKYFKTTDDVNPLDEIDIQAIFQQYIDNSISKTINLPKGTTFEEYKKLYSYAYKKGLKGFTTFNPDGSMEGILKSFKDNDRPVLIERHGAPERPKDLPCDIHKVTSQDDEYIILVGLLNGVLYEIFAGKLKNHEKIVKYKKGIIRKENKGAYDLILLDDEGKEMDKEFHITKSFATKNYNTIARLLSMSLRHGTPLEFIVEQLHKDTNFLSLEKVIARVIKKYIKDGEFVKSSLECPSCGGNTFIFESGCSKCHQCGWSKCD